MFVKISKPATRVLATGVTFFALASAQAAALDLSNAEVIVTSSTNPSYVGMTNTNDLGKFVLNGVPAGGVNVEIRRNGEIIAQGGAVTAGGNLNEAQVLGIVVEPASNTLKSK